jgi:RNase P subunit RPR2
MKTSLTKANAKEEVESFFKKTDYSSEDVRKIKRIAMKEGIKLQEKRQQFCKKCLSKLKGKIRVSKTHKTTQCDKCKKINKFRF